MQYEFNKNYSVIEIIIADGQTIPKPYDKIPVRQYDEYYLTEFKIKVLEIMERKLVNNQLVLLIKYEKVE